MDKITDYLVDHPQLIPFVVWPLLTALLSFAHDRIEAAWPRGASLLRKSGFNLYGLILEFWPKRLPPPPMLALFFVVIVTGCGASSGAVAQGVLDVSDAVCTEAAKQEVPDYIDFICSTVHVADGVSKTFRARVKREDAPMFAARHCGTGEVAP